MHEENQPLLSGDQSILWDAPLKLLILSRMGYRVTHLIHTADLFSRPPQGSTTACVTTEAYRSDGNVTRWSATMEVAPFLGRMPVHPGAFKQAGVDFRRVASFRKVTTEQAVEALSQGDWLGLTLPQDHLVAEGVALDQILASFTHLRKPISKDILACVPEQHRAGALSFFDTLFVHGAFKGHGMGLTQASLEILGKVLREHGATTELGTSVNAFNLTQRGLSKLFMDYIAHEAEARAAYNRSVQGGNEALLPLQEGQLPFYLIVRARGDGKLYRRDLTFEPGDTSSDVIARCAASDEAVAILGKALVLLLDLRLRSRVVLPYGGSTYAAQSARFLREMGEIIGAPLPVHPVMRLRVHALDALQDVTSCVKLPPYLVPFFGAEWVEGREIGHGWREAIARAHEQISLLCGEPDDVLARRLCGQGTLGERALGQITNVNTALEQYSGLVKGLAVLVNQPGISAEEKQTRSRCLFELRTRLARDADLEILGHLRRAGEIAIDARRALTLAELLPVTRLDFWDSRPFTHWVMAVPGWFEAILKRAELYVDEG